MPPIGFMEASQIFPDEKKGTSDKRIGDVEGSFIPIWLHFASTLGAKAKRRQSEGRVEASCVPTVNYIILKKPKIRVPLLRKYSGIR